MRRHMLLITVLSLLALGLAACAEKGNATGAIEAYLKAKVASDAGKLADLSCNDWEAFVQAEASSFESVKAELQNLSCQENGKDGAYTLVICEGQIVAEYDGEIRRQDISGTTYRATQEDDEWKMCGTQPN